MKGRRVRSLVVIGSAVLAFSVTAGHASTGTGTGTRAACPLRKATYRHLADGSLGIQGTCSQDVGVDLTMAATVQWTCSGCPNGIEADVGFVFLESNASHGTTFLDAGTQTIHVEAGGRWTLKFSQPPGGPTPARFELSGAGGLENFPPIMLAGPTRVTWSCSGCTHGFRFRAAPQAIVSAGGKHGTRVIEPGRYTELEAVGDAPWTVTFAPAATRGLLPRPAFSFPTDALDDGEAAGPMFAVAMEGGGNSCLVEVANLGAKKPGPVRIVAGANESGCQSGDSSIVDLALGTGRVSALVDDSPSPHGEDWTFWAGPLRSGSLGQVGGDWGWTDSGTPPDWGCAHATAAGGGLVVDAQVPNATGVDNGVASKPTCAAATATVVRFAGAAHGKLNVVGRWEPIGTDGKQILLAELDANGDRTGKLALIGLDGKKHRVPSVPAVEAKRAGKAWLTPDGLVLQVGSTVDAPHWRVHGVDSATVAEGRLVYVKGGALRVRRLGSGVDRSLLTLPVGAEVVIAAGSFGVGVAIQENESSQAQVYRLPWHVVDQTLTAG